MRTGPAARERDRTWGVYVIELGGDPLWVYVGQSYVTGEERLEQHLTGYKASRVVRREGGRLRPDLHGHLPRYASRVEAEAAERRLAGELRRRGFRVEGGH